MAARQDLERNLQSVRQALVDRMIYSDRVCFAAATTLAADTGLHPCTVRRALTRLQASGVIERVHGFTVKGKKVRSCAWRFCVGVLRRPKCATTETSFPKTSKTYNTYGVGAERLKRVCGKNKRRRAGVGEVVPIGEAQPPSRPNETVGQALFAAIVNELRAAGISGFPPRPIATAVRQGKESLAAGVDPDIVVAGCVTAIRRGKSRYTADIIGDLCLAKAGEKMSESQYRQLLELENNRNNDDQTRVREALAAHSRHSIEKGETT